MNLQWPRSPRCGSRPSNGANAELLTWIVRADAGDEMAGVAALSLPLSDNQHLGNVELRVAPQYRRQGIGQTLLAAVATRAKTAHRRVLAGFSWDLVAAGEAFARSVGGERKQVVRRSDLDLRAVDRDLVGRWLDVPSDVRDRYELWTVLGFYPDRPVRRHRRGRSGDEHHAARRPRR